MKTRKRASTVPAVTGRFELTQLSATRGRRCGPGTCTVHLHQVPLGKDALAQVGLIQTAGCLRRKSGASWGGIAAGSKATPQGRCLCAESHPRGPGTPQGPWSRPSLSPCGDLEPSPTGYGPQEVPTLMSTPGSLRSWRPWNQLCAQRPEPLLGSTRRGHRPLDGGKT